MAVHAQPTLDAVVEVPADRAAVRPHRSWWLRGVGLLALVVAAFGVFLAYLRMAGTMTVNADGAANARQAWDLLHGNLVLSGWTVSDVSFYTTELPQYALIELVVGLRSDVVHLAAAMTFTLVVLLVAALAVGRTSGHAALVRAGIAVAIVVVPTPSSHAIVFQDPDHTGTAVPLLVTWLLLDRARESRRLPWLVAAALVWAQLGDPLAMFVGAVPLIVVSAVRLYRQRRHDVHPLRGADARLLVAGVGSVALTQLLLVVLHWAGGFAVHPPNAAFSPAGRLDEHLTIAWHAMIDNFGADVPDLPGSVGVLSGLIHLSALVLTLVAIGLGVWRFLARRAGQSGDRIGDVLTVGIVVNLAAFIVSTQAGDAGTARQIIVVLPFGAVLAARLFGAVLAARPFGAVAPAVAVVLALLSWPLVTQAVTARPVRPEASEVSDWLSQSGLRYGIGTYWASHNITLATSGRVQVAPTTGTDPILGYRWESRADWYDATKHDARFVIVALHEPRDRAVAAAQAQFGEPVHIQYFDRFAVLVYDHNVLVGLPAMCEPQSRPSMAACPTIFPRLPGMS